MQNIKAQLVTLTILYAIAFMDGAFALGLSDGIYTLLGMGLIGILIWMWVDYARSKK